MKKHSYISLVATAAGILSISMPVISHAQTAMDVEAGAAIGGSIDAGSAPAPMKLRESLKMRIQQNVQNYSDNVHNNEDYRNEMLEKRAGRPSTTPPMMRMEGRMMMGSSTRPGMGNGEGTSTRPYPPMRPGMASSSMEERRDRIENRQQVRMDMFGEIRDRLVDQLERALSNLTQIRGRISARIDTEVSNGSDMSAAKALLVTADSKITAADTAIKALASFTPTFPKASAEASTTVDLSKPRTISTDAIKAVNDARKALGDVVASIAKALGATLHTSPDHE